MSLQIINESGDEPIGVYIPINEWKELKKKYPGLGPLEYDEPTKEQILKEFDEAIQELKLVEEGTLKARPASELLDEL